MFPWFSFLTYAVVTAMTPGPNNIMSMSNAGRKGFQKALPSAFFILSAAQQRPKKILRKTL